jgi:hypothetical protein
MSSVSGADRFDGCVHRCASGNTGQSGHHAICCQQVQGPLGGPASPSVSGPVIHFEKLEKQHDMNNRVHNLATMISLSWMIFSDHAFNNQTGIGGRALLSSSALKLRAPAEPVKPAGP